MATRRKPTGVSLQLVLSIGIPTGVVLFGSLVGTLTVISNNTQRVSTCETRLDALETKIDTLDQNGSRAMSGVIQRMNDLDAIIRQWTTALPPPTSQRGPR